jgi:hypothetical protein
MLLQGDSLAVQLFIGAAAISALSVAMTQAGWTHKWFVGSMFGFSAFLTGTSIGWPYLETQIPTINAALQTLVQTRTAWFFAGIIPALVVGIGLNEFQRRRKNKIRMPTKWIGIFGAMETLARRDLVDRYKYVAGNTANELRRVVNLGNEISHYATAAIGCDEEDRAALSDLLARLSSEKFEAERQHEKWEQTEDDCREALKMNIEDQLLHGELIAKGFLSPHTPGAAEKEIPMDEWRVLSLDWEGHRALGPNFEYIAVLIGKPGH